MVCGNADLLGALVAGVLPEIERAAIANHAASCDLCHALIEGLVETGAVSEMALASGGLLASTGGRTAGVLELGRGTPDGAGGVGEPEATAPGTSEFGGTDRFAVVRRIGAGGMGVVYEVWDREREAPFALKTLRALSPRRLSLFKNEFRALRGLSHRNLVTLGELVKDRGRWFFTMELVDGESFLSWVYPERPETGARFDEERLREGLRQLAGALCALHRSGKVHCDVKPSNVLVTRDGRVVVLDFGLVRDVRDPEDGNDHVIGTPAYMAPEQARGGGVGPAADWYAVGVMLYEALTGRLPFEGTVGEVLAAKMMRLPRRPSVLVADVPADLDALCMRLLAINPAKRAGADDLRRVLGGDAGTETMSDEAFLGRERELAALDAALEAGGPVVVAVRGESGVGKSTLLGRWLARAAGGGAVVLAGRCCERESVPYKAIDGVIEALARWLSAQPEEEVRALAPARAQLLARVFPALAALSPEPAPSPAPSGLEPAVERRHLIEAVRALLGRIAGRHRLVVSIDDLQWADADSLALLTELLRPPDAPPLVLVVAERGDERAGFAPPCPIRQVDVGPLAPADAAALAATLLPAESPDTAAAIAAAAGGHPLFVMELARARRGREAGAITRLEDALARRIAALGADARAIVEVVGAAGAPVAQAVVAEAAGVAFGTLAAVLVRLRDDHLVHTGGLGMEDRVDAYHSRVRAAVLQQLDASRAAGLHARLAAALERRPEVDPELLFGHWLEAGERARARRYAIEAADIAAAALAFDQAARLYRAALELGDDDGLALRGKLGAALVNAGRGAEAAHVFQEAAASAGGREALDLRRRAAEQLLRSGHVDAGLRALGEVLAGVGLRLPATGRAAIPSLLAVRGRLRLRGLALRRGGSLDSGALARVDACWSAAVGLLMIDSVRAAVFQSRMLRLALDAGDPYRASLALALEAGLIAARGVHAAPRVARILDQARALAAECGKPHAHGIVAAATGISAYLQGRFAEGLAASEEAERTLCTCTGVTWERDTIAAQTSWAQIYLGRFAALAARVPEVIRDAEERDDRYLATALRTGTLVWLPLVRGDTAGARIALDEGIRRWSERGFLHQHWDDLLARAELELFTGDAEGALARMRHGWRSLERAYVLEIQICREEALFVRGRAALRRARQLGAATSDGRSLLKSAAVAAARLYRERVPYITALGDLLSAGIAAARTELPTAAALLRRSLAAFDASGLALHAAVARLRLADLLCGSEGDTLRASALSYAAREQITALSAVTDTLAPGFSGAC
ncbi:MAG TPA: serine/threonine-protein kinase [Kofleriaceae bacterium]|nr:serine/threonine-protein kinase [Kofleriaceae bacterium]